MRLEYGGRVADATEKYFRRTAAGQIVEDSRALITQKDRATRVALSQDCVELLCGQFLRLTLVTHEFERALGFLIRG